MKIYLHPASTCSRSVMLFLAEAGIPADAQVVDILQGEHYQDWFTAINPKRLVPVIEDDGFVLSESAAILVYLAEKTGSPTLPSDPRQRARVHELMHWLNSDFYKDWGYNLIYPQLFPHHFRQPQEANDVTVRWGKGKVENSLRLMNDHLLAHGGPYLLGDQITLADFLGAGIFSAGELVRNDLSAYPNVARWYANMKALPSWPKVCEVLGGFCASLKDKPFVAVGA